MGAYDDWHRQLRRAEQDIIRRIADAHIKFNMESADFQVPPAGAAANGPPDPMEDRLIAELLAGHCDPDLSGSEGDKG